MITIDPPFFTVGGVTVFRDHVVLDQFYVLPPSPRLVTEGDSVSFSLLKYRFDLTEAAETGRDSAGGGFATMEIEAALPREKLAAIEAEVARQSGRPDAKVSSVVFRTAVARAIIAHTEGSRLIEDLVQTSAVSPVAPHSTALSLSLSPAGATLLEKAVLGGDLPVGVVYELGFLALSPAIDATARVDFERAYDRIAASIGVEYQAVRAELDADFQWLVENDVIHIEVTSFSDAEDAARQRDLVMALIKTRIEQGFFRTSMPPKPEEGMGGAIGKLLGSIVGGDEPTASSAILVLKAKVEVEDELKTLTLTYNGRTAVPLTHVATGFLAAMHDEETPLDIREIDLDDPFFSRLEVRVVSAIGFGDMPDLLAVKVDLAFGEHRASYVLTREDASPKVFQAAARRGDSLVYTYEVELTFDEASGSGPLSIHAGPFSSDKRSLVIQPADCMHYQRLTVMLGPVDLHHVPKLLIRVRAAGEPGEPDRATVTLTLDENHKEALFTQRLPRELSPSKLFVRPDWVDSEGTTHTGEEVLVQGDVYIASGPYKSTLHLRVISAADWESVIQVAVQIRYRDGERLVDHDFVFVPSDGREAKALDIPLLDPEKRSYEWTQTILRVDGTTESSDWAPSDRSTLVVAAPKSTTTEVRIVLIGKADGAAGVRVDLFAEDPEGKEQSAAVFLIPGAQNEKTVKIPLGKNGEKAYRYEVRKVTTEGEVLLKTGEDSSDVLIVTGAG